MEEAQGGCSGVDGKVQFLGLDDSYKGILFFFFFSIVDLQLISGIKHSDSKFYM